MTSSAYSHHFSINNLPFGVVSSSQHPQPQCATRLSNTVIFLGDLERAGLFRQVTGLPRGAFDNPTLNAFAALDKRVHKQVRQALQSALQGFGDENLPTGSTEPITAVRMHLPVSIPAFTDFSCSLNHVKNAGRAILNDDTPPPSFFHFPIGYGGRASTIVPSGTPITRPLGHFYDRSAGAEKNTVVYGPSQAMDYELEIGVVVGKPVPPHHGLNAKDADEHIFGLVLLNDWSARDIQGLEMVPLGPLNGKAFGTTISPWIVTLDALEPFKAPGPGPHASLPRHLQDIVESNYAIRMKVELEDSASMTLLSESRAQDLFWSCRQMCAHLASTGCDLRTGDILGTGTVSGPTEGSYGCLLEATQGGKVPVVLSDGSSRHYLQDGDVVRMSAVAGDESSGVGFGECVGELKPARAVQ
ncbi:fumarylacetoacetate hydrolase [Aspergillus udagawae]|uniref:Fumarylacetoacetase n=1 Tax=Aspergillus udagawae TaxID=91492 RepID=A0A8H3NE22_9EURO|nr:fumarylacetoacetate hydrolase [Aspergillus udagawae]